MTGPLTEALNLVFNFEPGFLHMTALRAIFKTDNAVDVYALFLKKGWSTTREVRDALDMAESTAYRVVDDLKEAGVIGKEKYTRVRGKGPVETVWRLNDDL